MFAVLSDLRFTRGRGQSTLDQDHPFPFGPNPSHPSSISFSTQIRHACGILTSRISKGFSKNIVVPS